MMAKLLVAGYVKGGFSVVLHGPLGAGDATAGKEIVRLLRAARGVRTLHVHSGIAQSALELQLDPATTDVASAAAAIIARVHADLAPWLGRAAERANPLDPARLSIIDSLVSSVAEEMGASLRHTALSPNIKERRDYSCAVFDAEGNLLAQAAHIPVHLGAIPESVRARRRAGAFPSGDLAVLNDPFLGGTHLRT